MRHPSRLRHLAPLALALALALAPPAAGEEATVRVAAGTALREVASPVALVLARVEEDAELPVLDRSGSWVRVALGETTGWVDLADAAGSTPEAAGGPTGEGAPSTATTATDSGVGAVLPFGEDPRAALAAARELLREGARELAWGRFAVLTDRPDHPLVALGQTIAGELPALHARRYGLPGEVSRVREPSGPLAPPSLGSVVLFAREADYRAYLAITGGESAAYGLAGHAAGGVAALPLGDRTARQAAGTLLHELAHLLNERAFGPGLPTWLDEGLAGDLELVEIGAAGELLAERWAEGATGYRGERGRSGPLIALDRLLADAARGRLETLPQLAALDRAALAGSPRRAELYALAALWVRFLLDDPGRAAALRTVLATLAAAPGAPPADGGAALLAAALDADLDADLAALERPFRLWLRDLARLR